MEHSASLRAFLDPKGDTLFMPESAEAAAAANVAAEMLASGCTCVLDAARIHQYLHINIHKSIIITLHIILHIVV